MLKLSDFSSYAEYLQALNGITIPACPECSSIDHIRRQVELVPNEMAVTWHYNCVACRHDFGGGKVALLEGNHVDPA